MIEIRENKVVLITPITFDDISSLSAGDIVWVDGTVLTGRDSVHYRVVEEDRTPPVLFKDMVLYHAGPIVKKAGEEYVVVASGPTTSMRMERLEYEFIKKTGVRIIVGKGGMGENTERACKEFGTVHCVFPAGCAVTASREIKAVKGRFWEDLGMAEMIWHFDAREFGPLVVSIDTKGRNLFKERRLIIDKRVKEAKERLYSEVEFMR